MPHMEHIVGQDESLSILQAATSGQRLHHAWIFHGPHGVGKSTTARALAGLLLCHQPQQDLTGQRVACGGCESCQLICGADAAHPDLHLIHKELARYSDDAQIRARKQLTIPVEILRSALLEPAARSAMLGHNKVFILEEAEILQPAGQNTLLKMLEEPPPGTYFFLITTRIERLLPTIRSRCQAVGFGELEESVVREWLRGQPAAKELDDGQVGRIVDFAAGSLGRAVVALEYRLDRWHESILHLFDQSLAGNWTPRLGSVMTESVTGFAEAWVKQNAGASKEAANKAALGHLMRMLSAAVRRGLRSAADAAAGEPAAVAEVRVAPWARGTELLREAERQAQANVSIPLLLDNLAIQLAAQATPA